MRRETILLATMRKSFDNFLARFTYAQRYWFYALIFLLCAPFPTYWVLRTHCFYVKQAELQMRGSQEAKVWFQVIDAVSINFMQWANLHVDGIKQSTSMSTLPQRTLAEAQEAIKSYPYTNGTEYAKKGFYGKEVVGSQVGNDLTFLEQALTSSMQNNVSGDFSVGKEHYAQVLNSLTDGLHQLAYAYRLVLQNNEWELGLAQAVFFSLVEDQIVIANLYVSFLQHFLSGKAAPQTNDEITTLLEYFKRHYGNTKKLLDLTYSQLEEKAFSNTIPFAELRELLLETYRSEVQFANTIQHALEGDVENPAAIVLSNTLLLAYQSIHNITKCRDTANALFNGLMENIRDSHHFQILLIVAVLCLLLMSILACFALHLLSRPLAQLSEYLQGILKGKYTVDIPIHKQDELGQCLIAFQKLGHAIEDVKQYFQSLCNQLDEAVAEFKIDIDTQARAIHLQQESLSTLESIVKQLASKSNELAVSMQAFTLDAGQKMVANIKDEHLNQILEKMHPLSDNSANILHQLSQTQTQVTHIYDTLESMMKVSERASLLSLNAAIEVLHTKEHQQSFSDITEKIQHFSEKTSQAVHSFEQIIWQISQKIVESKSIAENGLKELTIDTQHLKGVNLQLNNVSQQSNSLLDRFKVVDQMLRERVDFVKTIETLIGRLATTLRGSLEMIAQLSQNVDGIKEDSQQLRAVVDDCFKDKEGELQKQ